MDGMTASCGFYHSNMYILVIYENVCNNSFYISSTNCIQCEFRLIRTSDYPFISFHTTQTQRSCVEISIWIGTKRVVCIHIPFAYDTRDDLFLKKHPVTSLQWIIWWNMYDYGARPPCIFCMLVWYVARARMGDIKTKHHLIRSFTELTRKYHAHTHHAQVRTPTAATSVWHQNTKASQKWETGRETDRERERERGPQTFCQDIHKWQCQRWQDNVCVCCLSSLCIALALRKRSPSMFRFRLRIHTHKWCVNAT